MFEFLKKKGNNPGNNPNNNDEGVEAPEAPEVDGTLSDIDAALAAADRAKANNDREVALAKKREREEQERQALREAERYSGSRCGCG